MIFDHESDDDDDHEFDYFRWERFVKINSLGDFYSRS